MAHIDVVPARREDWSVDPWTFLERDGWFYGRGRSDNKAGAAMLVANVITLKRAGWQPARDLIVVLTGDEETAQRGIQSLLAEASRADRCRPGVQHRRRRRDAEGRPSGCVRGAGERKNLRRLSARSDRRRRAQLARPARQSHLHACRRAHADRRAPVSAARQRRDADVPRAIGRHRERTDRDRHARRRRVPPDQAAAARLSRSPFYNAQLRTTCVATKVEAGHANNALAAARARGRELPHSARTVRRRRRGGHPQAGRREGEGHRHRAADRQPAVDADAGAVVAHRTACRKALARRFPSFR